MVLTTTEQVQYKFQKQSTPELQQK